MDKLWLKFHTFKYKTDYTIIADFSIRRRVMLAFCNRCEVKYLKIMSISYYFIY